MLTEIELKNLKAFVTTGAKAISQNQDLEQSVATQACALELLRKLDDENTPKPVESAAAESLKE